ncbi:MAG: cytochrome c-type biogenesis protein CcmH [Actinomycetota bacterium]|nr:cytochrome c-type biogenesis protein CcmH [Actinomycetota bacterium]
MRLSNVSVVLAVFLLALAFAPSGMAAGVAQTKAADVIGELRSVTCEGERLEDCRSDQSAELRDYIGKRVAEGWSKKKIINQAIATYGNQILLAPLKTGFALWLWLTPFVLVAGAGVMIWARSAAWAKKPAPPKKPSGKSLESEDAYAIRVAKELKDFRF